jgi:predicted Zn-dependent protease with MMP-like domain
MYRPSLTIYTFAGVLLLEKRPKQVTIPKEMERNKFAALVAQALDNLPKTFREKLTHVAIIVKDLPAEEAEAEGLLLGLFHGIRRGI